jgi:DNA-binding MarR family transcriptional regulator
VVQAYVLDILLSSGGQGLTALSRALRLDKSTASRVVAGMSRRGLISWSRKAEDRRAKVIIPTPEGRGRYLRLRRAVERDNARLLASYPPRVRRALIDLLSQLAEQAESPPMPRRATRPA